MPIILDPLVFDDDEQVSLGGVELNDGVWFTLEAIDAKPSRKRPEWITGADSDGALLGRDPLHDNAELSLRVRVVQQAIMDTALDRIGDIVQVLEEAELQPDGVALQRLPAGASADRAVTAYVLTGEIDELPASWSGDDTGWFVRAPVFTIRMTCKPFWYGTEVVGTASTSTAPMMTLVVADVAGDVPAEGRLIITDNAAQGRRHVEWGLESRYYSASTTLILDSDQLNTGGTAGVDTTRTGAYDPNASGNSVIRATLVSQPVTVCKTGNQQHVGSFRVKARVWPSSLNVMVRLGWQVGDGPMRRNPWAAVPSSGGFVELDLGTIEVPSTVIGNHRWTGNIEAYTTAAASVGTDTVDVDFLELVPCGEGYGVARAGEPTLRSDTIVARDEFTSIANGTVLNARVAPSGGTWATSGAATDFTAADPPDSNSTEPFVRATVSDTGPRFAILGSTSYATVEVGVNIRAQTGLGLSRAIAHWTDANNYAFAEADFSSSNDLRIGSVVAGVTRYYATRTWRRFYDTWYTLRFLVYPSGSTFAQILDPTSGAVLLHLSTTMPEVATAGAIATGKPGFADQNASATFNTRFYDSFYTGVPEAEPYALHASQTLQITSSQAVREDSSGSYYGNVPVYRGGRFYVPPAGIEDRDSRVAVKARRNDVTVSPDPNIADSLTVQVAHTPRWLIVAHHV